MLNKLMVLISLTVFLMMSWGCGDEPEPADPEFPVNPGAISVDASLRGMPLEFNRSYAANRIKYESIMVPLDDEDTVLPSLASSLFIYEQIYSEYAQATDPTEPSALDERVEAIYEEYETEIGYFEKVYVVVDLQRIDREWLADWEGQTRDEPENRNAYLYFGHEDRDDYWDDVQDYTSTVAADMNPEGIILGMEMNLYYEQNPLDWSSFVQFFWAGYDAIKAANPDVRVSVGLNWHYFMDWQVSNYVMDGEMYDDVAPFMRAYRDIIEPLIYRYDDTGAIVDTIDFVSLAGIPDPDIYSSPYEVPEFHYGALRYVYPEGSLPVVWFQLGWPVSSPASSAPGQFYDHFIDNTGGITLEAFSWWGLSHLLEGDCTPITDAAVGADQTACYRGLYSNSGAETALSEKYFSDDE